MPADFTTNNPLGIGYQTGLFSGTPGEAINQAFFNAAFAGRLNDNKIFRNQYHCNVVQYSGMMEWLDEMMNVSSFCYPDYSLIETYGDRQQIKIDANATVPQYPGTVALHLADTDTFVSSQFILPQVGNIILTSPNGVPVKVISISQASAGDQTVTVQQTDTTGNTGAQTVTAGDELIVLSGSDIADCACPTGQFAVPDLPIITDLRMAHFGDKGEVCGDALHTCKWMQIEFTDECGNKYINWWEEALQKMYQRFEKRKFYERLFNPFFGIIPLVKARGLKWVSAATDAIVLSDVKQWVKELDMAGISCTEFAIFAGRDKFSQWQSFLNTEGIRNLQYSERPLADCAWVNMEYCGVKVEGLTLHIYKEPIFSNGKELGSPSMVFPNSSIIIPMCNRPSCNRSTVDTPAAMGEGKDQKMVEMVYFKSKATGQVWENVTDSNGIFGPRNTFGTGCQKHEWTIDTRFTQELHCMNWWGYQGL